MLLAAMTRKAPFFCETAARNPSSPAILILAMSYSFMYLELFICRKGSMSEGRTIEEAT